MLSEIVKDLGLTVLAVEHRVKEEKSLAGKLERKGDGYNTLEDITDILGCRVVCFLSGVQLLSLGIVGEYIGKIYMETKHRPHFIVSERTEEHEHKFKKDGHE